MMVNSLTSYNAITWKTTMTKQPYKLIKSFTPTLAEAFSAFIDRFVIDELAHHKTTFALECADQFERQLNKNKPFLCYTITKDISVDRLPHIFIASPDCVHIHQF